MVIDIVMSYVNQMMKKQWSICFSNAIGINWETDLESFQVFLEAINIFGNRFFMQVFSLA
jgi:hypothetical protein